MSGRRALASSWGVLPSQARADRLFAAWFSFVAAAGNARRLESEALFARWGRRSASPKVCVFPEAWCGRLACAVPGRATIPHFAAPSSLRAGQPPAPPKEFLQREGETAMNEPDEAGDRHELSRPAGPPDARPRLARLFWRPAAGLDWSIGDGADWMPGQSRMPNWEEEQSDVSAIEGSIME
jgi:hypothetical protein